MSISLAKDDLTLLTRAASRLRMAGTTLAQADRTLTDDISALTAQRSRFRHAPDGETSTSAVELGLRDLYQSPADGGVAPADAARAARLIERFAVSGRAAMTARDAYKVTAAEFAAAAGRLDTDDPHAAALIAAAKPTTLAEPRIAFGSVVRTDGYGGYSISDAVPKTWQHSYPPPALVLSRPYTFTAPVASFAAAWRDAYRANLAGNARYASPELLSGTAATVPSGIDANSLRNGLGSAAKSLRREASRVTKRSGQLGDMVTELVAQRKRALGIATEGSTQDAAAAAEAAARARRAAILDAGDSAALEAADDSRYAIDSAVLRMAITDGSNMPTSLRVQEAERGAAT